MTKTAFTEQFTSGHFGDVNTYKARLTQLSNFIYDNCLKDKGTASPTTIAAITDPTNKDMYRIITAGGALNSGDDAITTIVGDVVIYNATTELWEFLVTGAAINV